MSKANLGPELKRLRHQKKMSQADLSTEGDVTLSFIKEMELNHQQPSITTLFKLARGLGVTPDELIMPSWERWLKEDDNY